MVSFEINQIEPAKASIAFKDSVQQSLETLGDLGCYPNSIAVPLSMTGGQ